jgi:hypothetical protein
MPSGAGLLLETFPPAAAPRRPHHQVRIQGVASLLVPRRTRVFPIRSGHRAEGPRAARHLYGRSGYAANPCVHHRVGVNVGHVPRPPRFPFPRSGGRVRLRRCEGGAVASSCARPLALSQEGRSGMLRNLEWPLLSIHLRGISKNSL